MTPPASPSGSTSPHQGASPGPGLAAPHDVVAALPALEECVVLLDFDGTLSDLVDDPGAAAPVAGAAEAVEALASRTRVLLVSGRAIDDLRPRLPDTLDVTFAGGHGAELAHGRQPVQAMVDDVDLVTRHRDQAVTEVRAVIHDEPGWVVEVKPTGLAVHSRMVDDPALRLDRIMQILEAHEVGGMEVAHGHDVVELRPVGVHKGVAVARLLADDDRIPVAFGDDVTDEDMFAEVVSRDGLAVLVATSPRPTHARWRVADPDAMATLLAAWATTYSA